MHAADIGQRVTQVGKRVNPPISLMHLPCAGLCNVGGASSAYTTGIMNDRINPLPEKRVVVAARLHNTGGFRRPPHGAAHLCRVAGVMGAPRRGLSDKLIVGRVMKARSSVIRYHKRN